MASILDLLDYLPNKFFTVPLRTTNQFLEGVLYNFTPQANATTNYTLTYRGYFGKIYDVDSGSSNSSTGLAIGNFNLGEFDSLPIPGNPITYGGILSFHATYGSQTRDYTWQVIDNSKSLGNPSATTSGSGNVIYFGNSGSDTVRTGSGSDYIDGGNGVDSMSGGAGNDVYYVTAGDKVYEKAGEGIDVLVTQTTYLMTAGQELEVLISAAEGRSVKLYGNERSQTIVTVNGNDTLEGRGGSDTLLGFNGADILRGGTGNDALHGGAGNDVLTGGTQRDTFYFETALGSRNVDHITDFRPVDDTIRLDKSATLFAKIAGTGTLTSSQFKDITDPKTKLDANDRILYNHDTGRLYYDSDGSGGTAKVQFAILDNDPVLTHSDFFIV